MGKELVFRIKVEMVESEAEPSLDRCPQAQEDGSFSLVLPESDELNISALDRAALDVSFPALREALWRYLAEAGEKTSAPSRAPELGAGAYGRKAAPINGSGTRPRAFAKRRCIWRRDGHVYRVASVRSN